MPRYFVTVIRTVYATRSIEVEAENAEDATAYLQFDEIATEQRAPWIERDQLDDDEMQVQQACGPDCKGWRLVDRLAGFNGLQMDVEACTDCARFDCDDDALEHVHGTGEVRFQVVDELDRNVDDSPSLQTVLRLRLAPDHQLPELDEFGIPTGHTRALVVEACETEASRDS